MPPQRTPKMPKPRWETPKPRGVTGSYGDLVIEWAARELKLTPAAWQAYALRQMLRHDAAGDLLARIALVSTGRQNGKSVIVRMLTGWLLDEGQYLDCFADWGNVLLAAHDGKQARIVYRAVKRDLEGVPRIVDKSRLTELYGLESHNLRVDTVSHVPGSARGLSAGLVAFDEVLTQVDFDMWEVLQPVQSAIHSPLMLLTSTAGNADSVLLRSLYDRLYRIATKAEKPDPSFYGCWWASEDADAGLDWRAIKQANPSFAEGRPSRKAIELENKTMPPNSWRKERLNHWIEVRHEQAFNLALWGATRTPRPLEGIDPPYVLGVDIQPGWERATIVAAAVRPDGRIGVEVYRDLRADEEAITADSLIAHIEAFPQPVSAVVYDSVSGAAAAFDRHGQNAWGIEWRSLKPNLVVAACMDTAEMVQSGRLAVDDPLLDSQIGNVAKRPVGQEGGFRFSRAQSVGPIDAFMATVFAANAAATVAPPPSIK